MIPETCEEGDDCICPLVSFSTEDQNVSSSTGESVGEQENGENYCDWVDRRVVSFSDCSTLDVATLIFVGMRSGCIDSSGGEIVSPSGVSSQVRSSTVTSDHEGRHTIFSECKVKKESIHWLTEATAKASGEMGSASGCSQDRNGTVVSGGCKIKKEPTYSLMEVTVKASGHDGSDTVVPHQDSRSLPIDPCYYWFSNDDVSSTGMVSEGSLDSRSNDSNACATGETKREQTDCSMCAVEKQDGISLPCQAKDTGCSIGTIEEEPQDLSPAVDESGWSTDGSTVGAIEEEPSGGSCGGNSVPAVLFEVEVEATGSDSDGIALILGSWENKMGPDSSKSPLESEIVSYASSIDFIDLCDEKVQGSDVGMSHFVCFGRHQFFGPTDGGMKDSIDESGGGVSVSLVDGDGSVAIVGGDEATTTCPVPTICNGKHGSGDLSEESTASGHVIWDPFGIAGMNGIVSSVLGDLGEKTYKPGCANQVQMDLLADLAQLEHRVAEFAECLASMDQEMKDHGISERIGRLGLILRSITAGVKHGRRIGSCAKSESLAGTIGSVELLSFSHHVCHLPKVIPLRLERDFC